METILSFALVFGLGLFLVINVVDIVKTVKKKKQLKKENSEYEMHEEK